MNRKPYLFLLIFTGLAVLGVWGWGLKKPATPPAPSAAVFAPYVLPIDGFTRADGSYSLRFPRDFGAHPDYLTEWWYYIGNLTTEEGRHFGYQFTIFRRAISPPGQAPARLSDLATGQIYMGHFALTDVSGGDHTAYERFARNAGGLAGAEAAPFQVWLDDWRIEETGPGTYRLQASQGDIAIDFLLTDRKGPILHGADGYSQKGPGPGNASYYYSLTDLHTTGTIRIKGVEYSVTGSSWNDHEFSTSALSEEQVGWDWFALQLDDGSEWMVFDLRRADGTIDPYSSGTYIAPDGSTRHLEREAFQIEITGYWTSPESGASYPSGWRLTIPELDLTLEIKPYLKDQELNLSFTYWEGAVSVQGVHGGKPVSGEGYVELTGYAKPFTGDF